MSLLIKIAKTKNNGGLFKYPGLVKYFDGDDDYASLNNSGVASNPYDLGRTDAFSFAGIMYPTVRENIRFFEKRTSNSGYTFGTTTDGLLFIGFNTGTGLQGIRASSGYNMTNDPFTICIGTYDASGSTDGLSLYQYRYNAALSAEMRAAAANIVQLGATSLGATSLKNTTPILIGKNYPGGTALQMKAGLSHLSFWNKTLSRAEADDLAMKMTADNVTNHSAYAANCKGYWREWLFDTVVNAVDPTYNGTLYNF